MLCRLAPLSFLIAASFIGSQMDGQVVPDTLGVSDSPVPLWVAADIATNMDGSLRSDMFLPAVRSNIEAMLNLPMKDGCIQIGTIVVDQRNVDQDRSTLEAALRSSHLIAIARVASARAGFFQGVPGQLVAVVPESVYKGEALAPTYFEFFPTGTLTVAGKRICKTDDDYSAPAIGETQLLTANAPFGAESNVLIAVSPADFVAVSPQGQLKFPKRYLSSDPTLATIDIAAVRVRLRGRFGPPTREK